jgi:hypothetical protein
MKLDGVGDYVTATTGDIQAFTLQATIRMPAFPLANNEGIIAKYVGQNLGGAFVDQRSFALAVSSDGKITLNISPDGSFAGTVKVESGVLTAGNWYSLEAVYDPGNRLALYVNGSLVEELTSGVPASIYSNASVPLWVGSQYTVRSTAGGLENVAFSDTIQIAKIVGVVEYDFRENNGLVIPDRSGNGNDGTLVVNSSLAQIFAPTALETAYTFGDGRTRPHYVTVDSPNEKEFRTEII